MAGARIPHAGRRRACRLARPRSVDRGPQVEMTPARLARAVVYRTAVPEDIGACLELRGKTRENAISVERLQSAGITLESWTHDVAEGALPGHVALSGGKIVGYCFGFKDTGEIAVLALLPEFESMGIGKVAAEPDGRRLGEPRFPSALPGLLGEPDDEVPRFLSAPRLAIDRHLRRPQRRGAGVLPGAGGAFGLSPVCDERSARFRNPRRRRCRAATLLRVPIPNTSSP